MKLAHILHHHIIFLYTLQSIQANEINYPKRRKRGGFFNRDPIELLPKKYSIPNGGNLYDDDEKKSSQSTNRIYPMSICSIQGKRHYMEDEYFTNQNGSFCSVFDGHGGSAVSKYLRQNLYARYLQAKAKSMMLLATENKIKGEEENQEDQDALEEINVESENDVDQDQDSAKTPIDMQSPSLIAVRNALKSAFETIDAEVQKVSHWSFQGSTAVAIKLHKIANLEKTVLISANVGDSRAVLCRNGEAIEITKDHKPNDPDERERIESLGGRVEWFGPVDKDGNPMDSSERRANGKEIGLRGVYRINRNLALSRAIGDRSELPYVCSQVDIQQIEVDEEQDVFIVIASDGLFDVFSSSQEVVDFCHNFLKRSYRNKDEELDKIALEKTKRKMSKLLVREALRRGSMDNITVIVVWLDSDDHIQS
ncbi:hypothetical protein CTEN210_00730 [Chaetoceros tenuissimus]|uniref:PPM-type phosphatase domain-containing protein n=1 Tax=Chaetoceros tenuissimus TaxID=426638 RepID=A0AAD3CG97_9STRA|nr:hypothetical protein CTEN210_00730 [Chaetoceros tenuissimus]